MEKYLIDLGMFYQAKNKLHKAIQEFIRQQSRIIICSRDLGEYKKYLEFKIKELNKAFTKCTAVNIHFWSSDGKDQRLQVENVVSLTMLYFDEEKVWNR